LRLFQNIHEFMRKEILHSVKIIFAAILLFHSGFLKAQPVINHSSPVMSSFVTGVNAPIENINLEVGSNNTPSVQLVSFSGTSFTGYNELKWKTGTERDLSRFVVEFSSNGKDYQSAGERRPFNIYSGYNYTFRHYVNNPGILYYRLHLIDNSGGEIYSPGIETGVSDKLFVKIDPSNKANGHLQVIAGKMVDHYSIYDSHGGLVKAMDMDNIEGSFLVTLPVMDSGVYWIRLDGDDWTETHRFVIQ